MFKRLKRRRTVNARKEAAEGRMRAEHAAGILRSLVTSPSAPTDERLRSLVDSAVTKLTDTDFVFDEARDAPYAAAGYLKGSGSDWWAAAAHDAVRVLESRIGYDPNSRDYYKPGGTRDQVNAMLWGLETLPPAQPAQRPTVPPQSAQPTRKPVAQQQHKRPERRSHVYVITAEGAPIVKIGKADDPDDRVKRLQTGSPTKLTVAWTVQAKPQLELLLHERFADYREGGEWFDLTELGEPVDVVRDEVERIRKEAASRGYVARYFYDA